MTCLFSAMHRHAASQQEQHCFVPSASETEETVPNSVELKSNLLFLLFADFCLDEQTAFIDMLLN